MKYFIPFIVLSSKSAVCFIYTTVLTSQVGLPVFQVPDGHMGLVANVLLTAQVISKCLGITWNGAEYSSFRAG
jgi:hypothetical protein